MVKALKSLRTGQRSFRRNRGWRVLLLRLLFPAAEAPDEIVEPVHLQEDDGRDEQRQDLRHDEAADDCDAKWLAEFRTRAATDGTGRAPSRAQNVVIMIGRKRRTHAS